MNSDGDKKIKRVLVTGGTGFVGQHLLPRLVEQGYLVRVLVRRSYRKRQFTNKNLEQIEGELLDPDSLKKACKGMDFVIHLAGQAHVTEKNGGHEINLEGTRLLLDSAIESNVSRLLLMSSSLALEAEKTDRSRFSYGFSKLAAEKLLMSEHCAGNIEGIVLRPVNIYGPGMRGNIARLMILIARGIAPPLPTLETKISLVGIQDLCEAVILALRSDEAIGGTYLVTDGQEYSINRIEEEIYRVANKKMRSWRPPRLILFVLIQIVVKSNNLLRLFGIEISLLTGLSVRSYENLTRDNLFENTKLTEDLGFKPRHTFYGSLPEIYEEIKSARIEPS